VIAARALLLLWILASVTSAARAEPRALEIVASIYPLEMIAREIAGDRAAVTTLLPAGASPHSFEPPPSDMARLQRAELFLRAGGGLDDWTEPLLGVAPATLQTLTLAGIEPVRAAGEDPHAWLDPLLLRDAIAPELTRLLIECDPAGEPRYLENLRGFQTALEALHLEIRSILSGTERRGFVAFHNAWRHFARRYDLEQIAVVEAFPGEEPTPAALVALIRVARQEVVTAILVEPQLSSRIAEVIAAEFGGRTILVDPLGDPNDPARSSYADLLRFNARAFRRALGGEAP
jgi:ABC-type Zn uptake system ZnuABC Zn-binding protein ZnuA